MSKPLLPEESAARKALPVCSGVLDYFPSALIRVAERSKQGNDQHNPGQPLHHARGKSSDHLDALVRHLLERDLVGVAWRALAALQEQEEANGAPLARGAKIDSEPEPSSGWQVWGGGVRPVPRETLVDVAFRNGDVWKARPAYGWRWDHAYDRDHRPHDIVAWRLATPNTTSESPK